MALDEYCAILRENRSNAKPEAGTDPEEIIQVS